MKKSTPQGVLFSRRRDEKKQHREVLLFYVWFRRRTSKEVSARVLSTVPT